MFKLQIELVSFLIFSSFVLFISVLLISLAYIFNTPQRNLAKLSAYECGFQKISAISLPFDVQFYRVAIIFLIFDVEIAFLFPWAVCFNHVSAIGQLNVFLFVCFLLLGFMFEWRINALKWVYY